MSTAKNWSITTINLLLERTPVIWLIFLAVFLFFYFIPSLIIVFNIDNNYLLPDVIHERIIMFDISKKVLYNFHLSSYIFLFSYMLPLLYWSLLSKLPFLKLKRSSDANLTDTIVTSLNRPSAQMNLIINLITLAAVLGCAITLIYFIFIGWGFLGLLGSDASMEEFRFFLYADEYRYFNYLLELARRILLPISVTFFIFVGLMKHGRLKLNMIILWLIMFLSGVMTLDRGPIFLSLALMIIYFLIQSKTFTSLLFKSIFGLLILVIAGGSATYLQYNLGSDIEGFFSILEQGMVVLINRVFFDPAIMSLTYSFNEISGDQDFLALSFSRISVLWGNTYTGSFTDNSIYIAPVSVIGDTWRNFGHIGIFFVGFLLSFILLLLSKLQDKSYLFTRIPLMFLSVIFSFYIIVGNLFSIGPILILLVIYILAIATRIEKET